MNTDLQDQAVGVVWKTTEVTAATLKDMIQILLDNRHKIRHGEQSIKNLNLHGKLESMELADKDIKIFRHELRRHGVDFSIVKTHSDNLSVYFKAADVDRVYAGLRKCMQNAVKPSVRTVMQAAEHRANESDRASDRTPAKELNIEKGHER
jgi:hypothetical protein